MWTHEIRKGAYWGNFSLDEGGGMRQEVGVRKTPKKNHYPHAWNSQRIKINIFLKKKGRKVFRGGVDIKWVREPACGRQMKLPTAPECDPQHPWSPESVIILEALLPCLEMSKQGLPHSPWCVSLWSSSPKRSAKILAVDLTQGTPVELNLPIRILLNHKNYDSHLNLLSRAFTGT